jgi:RNA polymerase sigma-70 factor (sigma-E family)
MYYALECRDSKAGHVPCEVLRLSSSVETFNYQGNMMLAIPTGEVQEAVSVGETSSIQPRREPARTIHAGGWAADQALTDIYCAEYDSLVRMAASLVRDIDTAEEVVQDSFVATQGAWPQLRDSDKLLAYVRQSVMNRARSVIRRRMVVDRHPPKCEPDVPSAEYSAIMELERSAVMSALRLLPPRQREVLVLRFYLGLREGQIAATMGIGRGTVKVHIARAMTAMRDVLAPTA